MKWYYLERPKRVLLLRCFYAAAAFAYPIYVLLNLDRFKPSRQEVLGARQIQHGVRFLVPVHFFAAVT
ncbi:hypothetical protein Tcan_12792 [Toxocara canis]|uniref:Uncharacterized protein n=1 Tax=Toxocara canis TaxID=6265 RepID=A0A0B2UTI2_TOXCA|nr:hypothetical protein Tcan_12792 [Toxocara canis]